MTYRIGVFGHHDFLDGMLWAVGEQPSVQAVPIGFTDTSEIDDLARHHDRALDGVIAVDRHIRQHVEALLPGVPVVHIEDSRAALVQAMFRLTVDGVDVAKASLDALDEHSAARLYGELGIPTTNVSIARREGLPVSELIELHLEHARTVPGSVAITREPQVRRHLDAAGREVRLVYPHATAVHIALRQLLVGMSSALVADSRVVVALAAAPGAEGIEDELTPLGGTLLASGGGVHTALLTYGPLYAATSRFTSLPMLGRLADRYEELHIGLGVSSTAADSLRHAATALRSARELGPVGAVLSGLGGEQVVLEIPPTAETIESIPMRVLAQRAGLSVATLSSLHEALQTHGDRLLTTPELAAMLHLRPREARRVIERLELVGLAEREGTDRNDQGGRPRIRYRLHL